MTKKIRLKKAMPDLQDHRYAQVDTFININKNKGFGLKLRKLSYRRVYENILEFGRAGKGVLLLRRALGPELRCIKDKSLAGRLQKLMLEILKADPCSERGMRTVSLGDLKMLTGFQFHLPGIDRQIDTDALDLRVDRVNGEVSLTVPASVVADLLLQLPVDTEGRFVFAVAAVDFEEGRAETFSVLSPSFYAAEAPSVIRLTNSIMRACPKTLIIVFGIQYNGLPKACDLSHESSLHNTLSVLAVDNPIDIASQGHSGISINY